MSQESFLREDMLNRLILTVISTQNEIKDAIRAASGQIADLREEMREMRISKQGLEAQLEELRKENAQLKAQVEETHSSVIEVSRPEHTEQENPVYGLFADNLSPKPIIDHPCNEDSSRKRQFSWDLYRKLMEDIYGSSIDDKTFNTAREHLKRFRLPAIIRQVKDEFKIEAGKPFKAADPRGKLRAIELLEQTAAPFVPLRACVGSWGAILLLRYYWLRNEKKSSTTPSSVQVVEANDASASEEQGLCPPSLSAEESDSSEGSDVNPVAAVTICSQTTDRFEQQGKINTGKRCRSAVRKGKQTTKRKMTKKAN
ncbi:hypothetical protein RMATCC62417_09903 [Rhizopus microsporus]|nr:hypothetical protein RMATCC62417_09903 [Rhizopus microsporus]